MQNQIYNILNDMSESLNIIQMKQMKQLQEVLLKRLLETDEPIETSGNQEYLEMFLAAKWIEGCSERTISYYRSTISNMLMSIDLPIRKMMTENLRLYLTEHQLRCKCGKVTIDNIDETYQASFPG